jgi:hypothetical protein
MTVLVSQPLLAEIGMGIELHQGKIGMALGHGRHGAAADRMLTTEHQGLESEIQDGPGSRLHRRHHRFGRTKGNGHGAQVSEGQVLEIAVELGVVTSSPELTSRIAAGPKRVPGRKEVVPS